MAINTHFHPLNAFLGKYERGLAVGVALICLACVSPVAFLVAAILVGVRGSLPEFRNTAWLNHNAPNDIHVIMCAWFHATYGVWKGALTVVALQLFEALVGFQVLGRPGVDVARHLYNVTLIAMGVTSFLALIGSLFACLFWVKVWLDPHLSRSRNEDVWPPRVSRRNAFPWLLVPQILTIIGCMFRESFRDSLTFITFEFVNPNPLLALGPILLLFYVSWARTPQKRWKMLHDG